MEHYTENNQAVVSGVLADGFAYSHRAHGEDFYTAEVLVERRSGKVDSIPVTVSERLVDDIFADHAGHRVEIKGQFRSHNLKDGEKVHVILSVFAREVSFLHKDSARRTNQVNLDGYICKQPALRKAAVTDREIADVMLAVNRQCRNSDYIPCICWGRNAKFASRLAVGDRVICRGRIQSRTYAKRMEDGSIERRTAYEVSLNEISLALESEDGKEKMA